MASRGARVAGSIVVLLVALGACASAAGAAPVSMTFTQARANVGVQLSDATLFGAPQVAPFEAQIDPASGSISAGAFQVPQFATHITDPLDADVTVDFEIGTITGTFDHATGALALSGTAGGTLTAEGKKCTVSTVPSPLVLSTAGNSGGATPHPGAPFATGLTGPGAIAGQWTDMNAKPAVPGVGIAVCETVDERIGGPGGIVLVQGGDGVPPSPPQLNGTDPVSPGMSGTPRILGAAEAGSTVRVYAGPSCAGAPVASASAARLGSPGIAVTVAKGVTAVFSATATDAAGNSSACSIPISYRRSGAKAIRCVVPRLAGKTLPRARAALTKAGCKLGVVRRPGRPHRTGRTLVVKSSSPRAGARPADDTVDLTLGTKPRNAPRSAA